MIRYISKAILICLHPYFVNSEVLIIDGSDKQNLNIKKKNLRSDAITLFFSKVHINVSQVFFVLNF